MTLEPNAKLHKSWFIREFCVLVDRERRCVDVLLCLVFHLVVFAQQWVLADPAAFLVGLLEQRMKLHIKSFDFLSCSANK